MTSKNVVYTVLRNSIIWYLHHFRTQNKGR